MNFPLAAFTKFRAAYSIPSRDDGLIPFTTLYGTQEHLEHELMAGLEEDVHDFVILKGGRQVGGTTYWDALTLFWLQTYEGMIGMLVSDDDSNRDYRRDVLRQMLDTADPAYRYAVRMDNFGALAWAEPSNSRLLFAAAGKRQGNNLGRSKGLNFLDADEVASWIDPRAISALKASLSKLHPHRLSGWISTARGDGPFKEMWATAQTATATRAIFLAWWRHRGYRIEKESAIYRAYGHAKRTSDERHWIATVRRRYGFAIEAEQLAWYRWQLAEEFFGDEAMLAQEYGSLPEECFQAFGDKFIAPTTIRRLRVDAERAHKPKGYAYDWRPYLGDVRPRETKIGDATLTVWDAPDPKGVYLVAVAPPYGHRDDSPANAIEVFRLYPDQMVQVAEYVSDQDASYQYAWAALHLGGYYYKRPMPSYLIVEMMGTGRAILNEIQRVQNYRQRLIGSGPGTNEILDFLPAISHYLFRRPDSFTASVVPHWQNSSNYAPWLMHGLHDEIERETLVLRSASLIDELASLRSGEEGSHDTIEGGGAARDGRAHATAMACRQYLDIARNEIARVIPPKAVDPHAPQSVAQYQVASFLQRHVLSGRRN